MLDACAKRPWVVDKPTTRLKSIATGQDVESGGKRHSQQQLVTVMDAK